MSALTPRQMFLLDEACKPLRKAFGTPYLVGTAGNLERTPYRDVDVRLILVDDKYDALRAAMGQDAMFFLGLAIGEYLAARTGLPIDFQLQRRSEANSKHNAARNPLGVRELESYRGDASPALECDNGESDARTDQ